MWKMQTSLEAFGRMLAEITSSVYHYWRPKMQPPFICWAETGENDSSWADNRKQEMQIDVTVDYYTATEYDPTIDKIQNALNLAYGSWTLENVSYEDETALIHYKWQGTISVAKSDE